MSERVTVNFKLDADKHIKLRILSQVSGQTVTNILTKLIDRFLDDNQATLDKYQFKREDLII